MPGWGFDVTPLAPVEPIAPATPARPTAESSFDDHLQRASTPPKPAEKDRASARDGDASAPAANESRPAESAAAKPTKRPEASTAAASAHQEPQEEASSETTDVEAAEVQAAAEAVVAAPPSPPPVPKATKKNDKQIETLEKTGLEKPARRDSALGKVDRKEPTGVRGAAPSEPKGSDSSKLKAPPAAAPRDAEPSAAEDAPPVKDGEAAAAKDEAAAATSKSGQPADRAAPREAAAIDPVAKAPPGDSPAKAEAATPEPTSAASNPSSSIVPAASAAASASNPEHSSDNGGRREPATRRSRETASVAGAAAAAAPSEQSPAAAPAEPSAAASSPDLRGKADAVDSLTLDAKRADPSGGKSHEGSMSRADGAGRAEAGDRPARSTESGSVRGAAGRPVDGSNLSDADRVRLVQRVARAFHHVSETGGEVRLRLSPPELGAVRIEVAVRDGVMTAKLEAETPAARSLLFDNLPALRERLNQQDMRIERFDVELLDRQTAGQEQSGQGAASPDREQQRGSPRGLKRLSAAPAAAATAGAVRTVEAGRLNVVI